MPPKRIYDRPRGPGESPRSPGPPLGLLLLRRVGGRNAGPPIGRELLNDNAHLRHRREGGSRRPRQSMAPTDQAPNESALISAVRDPPKRRWGSPVREVRHAMGRLNQVTVEPADAQLAGKRRSGAGTAEKKRGDPREASEGRPRGFDERRVEGDEHGHGGDGSPRGVLDG